VYETFCFAKAHLKRKMHAEDRAAGLAQNLGGDDKLERRRDKSKRTKTKADSCGNDSKKGKRENNDKDKGKDKNKSRSSAYGEG
jgi:hypothetical protein